MPTFTLASPIPSIVRLPDVAVGLGTSQNKHIWKDASGVTHILCSIGGIEQSTHSMVYKCHYHYINTATHAHALIEGGWGAGMRHATYDINSGKLYGWGDYAQPGCFCEFDPVSMAFTFIKYSVWNGEGTDGEVWGSGFNICVGLDNKIYGVPQFWNTGSSWHCYQYDPAEGATSWLDMGRVSVEATDSSYVYVGADMTNVYVTVKASVSGLCHLYTKLNDNSGSWSEIDFGDATNSDSLVIHLSDAQDYFVIRHRVGDGAGTYLYYTLAAGGVTAVTPAPAYGINPILGKAHSQTWMDDTAGYHSAAILYYGTDFCFDYSTPIKDSQESSIIGYGNPATTYSSEIAYTGSFYSLPICAVVPMPNDTIYAFPSYAPAAKHNYANGTTIMYGPCMATYAALYVPATHSPLGVEEIYFAGYAKLVARYNPAVAWDNLTRADYTLTKNPHNIVLPSPSLNYLTVLDYDYNGVIWISGDHNTGGGNVFWYDPADAEGDSNGQIFPTWAAGGQKPTSMCHALNRTKMVIGGSDGYIYVIDAATKTVAESSFNIGVPVFLLEVSNDVIIVVDYTNDKVGRYQPSTQTMLTELTATGLGLTHFGFGASGFYARHQCKLELGPDGYAWMFMTNSIYRIHPTTCVFSKVVDKAANASPRSSTYGLIKFSHDGRDLLLYYGGGRDWDMDYYPNIFARVDAKLVGGVVAGKVGGVTAEKVGGVQQ
jgi:hypothetical protein